MAMQPKPASNTNLLALPEGRSWSATTASSACWEPAVSASPIWPTRWRWRARHHQEYFPADFAARRSTSDASPRSQDCAEDYKWGLERFIEEAQTLARFVHPNIVRVYRYFRANNTGYMVLHFEEGGSFKAWLKGLKRAPRQNELDKILNPLLDALGMVHGGAFLHRDIAPDNIIIRRTGRRS
jgi:serine/threonine protein kinase